MFIVPLWSWHEHANRSTKEEAILFSMHYLPILTAFGLYREEAQEESERKSSQICLNQQGSSESRDSAPGRPERSISGASVWGSEFQHYPGYLTGSRLISSTMLK